MEVLYPSRLYDPELLIFLQSKLFLSPLKKYIFAES